MLACVFAVAPWAQASPLTLNVIDPDKFGPAGKTYLFEGTVTNNTGAALQASDLFLDFNGYVLGVVSLSQLLGLPDFALADGATSAVVSLFEFTLAPTAFTRTRYVADVGISDLSGNISHGVFTVSVTVPEPGSASLVALSLLGAGLALRRRNVAA